MLRYCNDGSHLSVKTVSRKSDALNVMGFWHFFFWYFGVLFKLNRVRCSYSVGGELRKLKSYSSIV